MLNERITMLRTSRSPSGKWFGDIELVTFRSFHYIVHAKALFSWRKPTARGDNSRLNWKAALSRRCGRGGKSTQNKRSWSLRLSWGQSTNISQDLPSVAMTSSPAFCTTSRLAPCQRRRSHPFEGYPPGQPVLHVTRHERKTRDRRKIWVMILVSSTCDCESGTDHRSTTGHQPLVDDPGSSSKRMERTQDPKVTSSMADNNLPA